MKRTEIIRILEKAGFVATEGAKHTKMRHADGRWTMIPRHATITRSTTRQIEKQTGVTLLPR